MEFKFPESSIVNNPHKIEGPMEEAKKSFYEFAKSKVKYLSRDEIKKWHKETSGRDGYETTASYIISFNTEEGGFEKWINNLEIMVNRDIFSLNGKDFSDIIPFVLEHDIYEAWLHAKKGAASSLDVDKKHMLARRREFLLAAEQGLEDKFFEFMMAVAPGDEAEFRYALEYAKKKKKS
ncbi:hypothetical protein GYA13_00275 [Candidatus Kuenenbacteria bacterium]|nr:hypothetical protein [Candidatus Kuenenbacteria bacterium]